MLRGGGVLHKPTHRQSLVFEAIGACAMPMIRAVSGLRRRPSGKAMTQIPSSKGGNSGGDNQRHDLDDGGL